MDSQQVEHAAMYFTSTMLREILDYLLLFHEVMADHKLKQHSKVLFLFESLPAQSEAV
jgi:TFIIF-interacting CTD phosphatase-like protein